MGRHSYGYEPEPDPEVGSRTVDGAPGEPPPLVDAEPGDGTGGESSHWHSAGGSVL